MRRYPNSFVRRARQRVRFMFDVCATGKRLNGTGPPYSHETAGPIPWLLASIGLHTKGEPITPAIIAPIAILERCDYHKFCCFGFFWISLAALCAVYLTG